MKIPAFHSNKGYSLVEVLVAATLLGTVLGGSIRVLGSMNVADVTARSGTAAVSFAETAARLWQMGLTPDESIALLPVTVSNEYVTNAVVPYTDSSGSAILAATFVRPSSIPAPATSMPNSMGTLEAAVVTTTIRNQTSDNKNRTVSITAYRPSIR